MNRDFGLGSPLWHHDGLFFTNDAVMIVVTFAHIGIRMASDHRERTHRHHR